MGKSRYSDNQILAILKQNEQGVSVSDLCRGYRIISAQLCKWRARYGEWMTRFGEHADRGLATATDDGQPALGVRVVFPVVH